LLDEMTEAALKVLATHRRGFVLMVEGASIDKQSHAMDAERAIDDTIEFDNAIAQARRFAERDGETLVLVLSDHECSGFSVIGGLTGGVAALSQLPSDGATLIRPARQRVRSWSGPTTPPRFPAIRSCPTATPLPSTSTASF
jgi:alkaline phosphatase